MVKLYTHLHRYEDDPPPTVLLAFYLRYPNPFARHVLSCDVISREVDASTGKVKTQRLILKRGIVPRWASKWLEGLGMGMVGGGGLEAWVLEESEVWRDPVTDQPCLRSMTRNISHKKLMDVSEGTELFSAGKDGLTGTFHRTTAHIESNFGSGNLLTSMVRSRIEDYGARRFEGNAAKSREGMGLILSLLRGYRPLPYTREAGGEDGTNRQENATPTYPGADIGDDDAHARVYGGAASGRARPWRSSAKYEPPPRSRSSSAESEQATTSSSDWKATAASAATTFLSTTNQLVNVTSSNSAAPASFFLSRESQEMLSRYYPRRSSSSGSRSSGAARQDIGAGPLYDDDDDDDDDDE